MSCSVPASHPENNHIAVMCVNMMTLHRSILYTEVCVSQVHLPFSYKIYIQALSIQSYFSCWLSYAIELNWICLYDIFVFLWKVCIKINLLFCMGFLCTSCTVLNIPMDR
jgi:hypothetical protein